MKKLLGVVFTIALLVGVHFVAVQKFDDRELFTPPPDAAAEGFTREVMSKRWDQAQEYLAQPAPQAELEALEARLPAGENPDCKITSRDDQQASVDVTVREKTLTMSLQWQDGEWKVAQF